MNYITGLFAATPTIDVSINRVENRKSHKFRDNDGEITKLQTFYDKETNGGTINIILSKPGKFEHEGIKVELVGQISI